MAKRTQKKKKNDELPVVIRVADPWMIPEFTDSDRFGYATPEMVDGFIAFLRDRASTMEGFADRMRKNGVRAVKIDGINSPRRARENTDVFVGDLAKKVTKSNDREPSANHDTA